MCIYIYIAKGELASQHVYDIFVSNYGPGLDWGGRVTEINRYLSYEIHIGPTFIVFSYVIVDSDEVIM